ncbi:hypothetical protein DX116_09070 [Aeromicrobium endophyticum]|uniref:Uncharacterized protein n=2 Tax=Aeromicrobium endophyticum TaxID=2292704 RepID=A0A371PCK9_9ACTN|nr:hypothetical protein DX116_09070 [Aeromicrobium endophyticum]
MADDETLTVIELGQEDDSWFVQGTDDVDRARAAVREHVRGMFAGHLDLAEEVLVQVGTAAPTTGDDWWWQPVDPEEPDHEAYLRNAHEHATPSSARLVTGVWFR